MPEDTPVEEPLTFWERCIEGLKKFCLKLDIATLDETSNDTLVGASNSEIASHQISGAPAQTPRVITAHVQVKYDPVEIHGDLDNKLLEAALPAFSEWLGFEAAFQQHESDPIRRALFALAAVAARGFTPEDIKQGLKSCRDVLRTETDKAVTARQLFVDNNVVTQQQYAQQCDARIRELEQEIALLARERDTVLQRAERLQQQVDCDHENNMRNLQLQVERLEEIAKNINHAHAIEKKEGVA